MAEVALTESTLPRNRSSGLIWRLAWRNLWRNPRRTWLTAGGIAFACLLVSFSMALQAGTYVMMINSATGFLAGQLQISNPNYVQDEKFEQTLGGATELERTLLTDPALTITPRVHAYALVSAGERSFGGLLSGVDFERERKIVTFFEKVREGRLPNNDQEVIVGQSMARNLGVGVGDELVYLGSAKEGGIAALALTVSGIFNSGQAEVDRTMTFADISAVQNAFALGDEVHQFVGKVTQVEDVDAKVAALQAQLGSRALVRGWSEFMPDVVQSIELDRVGGRLVFAAILILVSFSVINTFLMVVFERTREFGMLLSIGMRPGLIARQILVEALYMWGLGAGIGSLLALMVVMILLQVGIPVAGLEELAETFYIEDRIYPAVQWQSLVVAPLILLAGTQLAGLFAMLRIRRLRPVTAMRAE
jgi:putative ABC transport system permease protein